MSINKTSKFSRIESLSIYAVVLSLLCSAIGAFAVPATAANYKISQVSGNGADAVKVTGNIWTFSVCVPTKNYQSQISVLRSGKWASDKGIKYLGSTSTSSCGSTKTFLAKFRKTEVSTGNRTYRWRDTSGKLVAIKFSIKVAKKSAPPKPCQSIPSDSLSKSVSNRISDVLIEIENNSNCKVTLRFELWACDKDDICSISSLWDEVLNDTITLRSGTYQNYVLPYYYRENLHFYSWRVFEVVSIAAD